jgi:hypothetical protein
MGLKGMLSGKWFTRLVMIIWIICGVSILVVFKNMELIVHGQLYNYGLVFSPDWANAYRFFTWLIFMFLGLPMALSGLALASSFLKVEQVPKRGHVVPQRTGPPRGMTKVESKNPVEEAPRKVKVPSRLDNGNCVGISCPQCKKVFGRALVMLDFRSGSNRMVSVCPYCNHVLGYTSDGKSVNDNVYVAPPDKKVVQ